MVLSFFGSKQLAQAYFEDSAPREKGDRETTSRNSPARYAPCFRIRWRPTPTWGDRSSRRWRNGTRDDKSPPGAPRSDAMRPARAAAAGSTRNAAVDTCTDSRWGADSRKNHARQFCLLPYGSVTDCKLVETWTCEQSQRGLFQSRKFLFGPFISLSFTGTSVAQFAVRCRTVHSSITQISRTDFGRVCCPISS